jgi:hypothetical protein
MTGALLWARAHMRQGWLSLLSVALVASLAGGAVLALVAGARRSSHAISRFAEHTGWPDVMVWGTSGIPQRVDDILSTDPRVVDRIDGQTMLATPEKLRPGQDGSMLLIPDGNRFRPQVLQGRLPRAGHPDELAVPEQNAAQMDLHVGDPVPIVGAKYQDVEACITAAKVECPTTPLGTGVVVGITRSLQDLGDAPLPTLLMARPDVLNASDAIARTNLVLVYTRAPSDINPLVEELSSLMPDGDVTRGDLDIEAPRRSAGIERAALLVAAALGALAGALVLLPSYGRHLTRRRDDAELLDSLGMAPRHRLVAGWLPGIVLAAVAAVLSIVVATALSPLFPVGLAREADLDAGVHADWLVLVPGALTVFAAVAGIAGLAAHRWSKGMRRLQPAADVGATARFVSACGLAPVPSEGARLALETGKGRRRIPVLPTVAAAAAGVALAAGSLIVAGSLSGLLDHSSRYGHAWNLVVTAPRDNQAFDAMARQLSTDRRVDGTAEARAGELRVRAKSGGLLEVSAVGYDSLRGGLAPTVLEGRLPASADEVALATDTMREAGVGLGDFVEISGPVKTVRARVVGRGVLPDVGAASRDSGVIVPMAMHRDLGAIDLVATLDDEPAVLLHVANQTNRDALLGELSSKGYRARIPLRTAGVSALGDIRPVALLLAGLTALIVAASTGHALVTGVRRRGPELAVLRALGMRPTQIRRVVLCQGVIFVAASLALGIPLGLVAGRIVWTAIASANRVLEITDIPSLELFALALVLLAIALLISIVPGRQASLAPPATVLHKE